MILIMLIGFLFPIAWVYVTSFKPPHDIFKPDKILFEPTLYNYNYIVNVRPSLKELLNSFIICVLSTAIVIAVSLPAAYSFARFKTGAGHLLFVTISTRMFPGVVAALPFFFAYRTLGLLDTHLGLILGVCGDSMGAHGGLNGCCYPAHLVCGLVYAKIYCSWADLWCSKGIESPAAAPRVAWKIYLIE